MEKTFDTNLGKVTLRGAMIDTDGTNLADGIEVKIDNKLIGEVLDTTFGEVEDFNDDEAELFVITHFDI